jgi:hypothetical protein
MAGISLILQNNPTVTQIDCGSSSPKLGGAINLSAFPNLQNFICKDNDITAINGYQNNANLTFISLANNKITGNIPPFTGTPNLVTAVFNNNLYSGSIPPYNSALRNFQCTSNQLTGTVPNFINNEWRIFQIGGNVGLTGPIPPALSSQTFMTVFICPECSLDGTVPNIDNCVKMQRFLLASNDFTGSIPNLSSNVDLEVAWFHNCRFTGTIPSLSNCTNLRAFLCNNQRNQTKLTGSIPSLSSLNNLEIFYCSLNQLTSFVGGSVSNTLGDFRAQDNQLTTAAVDAILAAFVAANKTTGPRTLNLGGTNASPTGGVNNPDKLTLESRGWLVTVTP